MAEGSASTDAPSVPARKLRLVSAARQIVSLDIDLTTVEAAVGSTSFRRGKTYARAGRVLSASWDPEHACLKGRVVGNGALYDTAVTFTGGAGALVFEEGECSCPVGWDCKHAAAVAIVVTPGATERSSGAARKARASVSPGQLQVAVATEAPAAAAGRGGGPGRAAAGSAPSPGRAAAPGGLSLVGAATATTAWEGPLRALLGAQAPSNAGDPLAIELVITMSGGSGPGAPRLKARLMRPGARGGWVNGSLSFSALDPWDVRGASYREDHLALAREFDAAHRAHMATDSRRYWYGYRDRDRTLDLSDWDARLWSLLDRAAQLGMVTVPGGGRPGEIPGYRRGELVLDVTADPDGAGRVRVGLSVDPAAALEGHEPLMFLGSDGHGLVMLGAQPEGDRGPGPVARGDVSRRPLRLVRLERGAPAELQRMLLDHGELVIPAGELERFATELAPALRRVAPIVSSDGSFTVPEVSGPELMLSAIHGAGHLTSVSWMWAYTVAGRRVELPLRLDASGPGFRDLDAEREALDHFDVSSRAGLAELGLLGGDGRPRADAALLEGLDTVRFISEVLPAIEAEGALLTEVVGDPLEYLDADGLLEVGVSTVEVAGERDWFDLGVQITVAGRELPFAPVFAAIARGEERMLLDDGTHFSLLVPELESLRALIEEARLLGEGSTRGSLRISRYQTGLWEELVGLGVVREQADAWRLQVDALRGLDELAELAPPAGLRATLRPYQLEGFRWLASLWSLGLGGILADDMGLGKTLQALALICHALEHPQPGGRPGPFLVIAPTSVVPNWVAEAERFAPALRVRALADTLARAGVSLEQVAEEADLVVTTYTLARLDQDHHRGIEWAGVILDEAQAVKNRNAKGHAAARTLDSPFKLAITGTPMENHLGELWALLSITAPGLFPDPAAFDEHFARPIERHGDTERLAVLRRRIRPLVKRRTKELVAAELPAKQEQILEVELHSRHRKLYDTHMQRERQRILGLLDDYDSNRFNILTAITRMRQLSLHAGLVDPKHLKVPSAKLDALVEQLADVADAGHRALVFSQFTGFLTLVRERLDAERISHQYLDGRTRNRGKVLDAFKQGSDPVFLISLKAGGFGLNLTEADYCFLLDPWWNPATENQAIDRTHRIGQTRQVMVYRLVSADTIEQKVVALAARKAALFRGVMDDGDLFAAAITADDIRGLLG